MLLLLLLQQQQHSILIGTLHAPLLKKSDGGHNRDIPAFGY